MNLSIYLPVAVEVFQLLLDVAAEANPVMPVQPLPHNTHAILTLGFVKSKVLDLGGNATTAARMTLLIHYYRCFGFLRYVPADVEERQASSRVRKENLKKNGGERRKDRSIEV